MSPLISSSELIEDDWLRLGDDQAVDYSRNLIVSLDRLRQHANQAASLPLKLGVLLEPTDLVEELVPFLSQLDIVVLQFKVFSDGRAFSQARMLRDRHAYCGDIRAVGDVLCDQLSFMKRNGINQFELAQGEDLELAFRTFGEISRTYQSELNQSCVR